MAFNEDHARFIRTLISARVARGLTIRAFEDRLGIDKQSVLRWERGDKIPSEENIKEIAWVLDAPLLIELRDKAYEAREAEKHTQEYLLKEKLFVGNEVNKPFIMRLLELRLTAGLRLGEVEQACKINQSKLSRYEHGDIFPSMKTVSRLLEYWNDNKLNRLWRKRAYKISEKKLKRRSG